MIIYSSALFQFHKGTIKTGIQGPKGDKGDTFQFHKGTIKTELQDHRRAVLRVSIP